MDSDFSIILQQILWLLLRQYRHLPLLLMCNPFYPCYNCDAKVIMNNELLISKRQNVG